MAGVKAALLALVLLSTACAAHPPVAAAPPVLVAPAHVVDVEALVRRGCYRCLEAAWEAAGRRGSAQQTFEIALLLAARSKELGLPFERWLDEARSSLPVGAEWELYLEVVTAQQPDPLSGDRDRLLDLTLDRRRTREVYDGWRQTIQLGPGSPLLRAYLDLLVVCRQEFAARATPEEREAAVAEVVRDFPDVPLLLYRAGLCGGAEFEQVTTVRAADPDFVDADLELGRRALQNRVPPDVVEGLARLRSARAAFPDSAVVPATIGELHQSREEWPEALEQFEVVLAIVPTHRDALLGKTVSLSQLDRYEEALGVANRLIELGNWFIGPAYFWRAWNEYQLNRIAAARADADRAKALMVNPALSVLSGMIEWKEKRLPSSEAEFQRAIEQDSSQCDAAFYLGSVRWERAKWSDSLAAFRHAEQCFELSVAARRETIARLSPNPETAAINARPIAAQEEAIALAEKRRAEAAQNVASLQKVVASAAAP
jgi:tetratricopeptide (TPR) repeat protein